MINKIPGLVPAAKFLRLCRDMVSNHAVPFMTFAAPGHFYSPIPSLDDLGTEAHEFEMKRLAVPDLSDVPINEQAQLDLAKAFSAFHADMPFQAQAVEGVRYCFDNSYFSYGDGTVLYCMLRHLRPKQVVEIGSGFSTALMLDARSTTEGLDFELISVEPYPDRLLSLIRPEDEGSFTLHQQFVQDVPLEVFKQLEPGSVLFVDSSHVGKLNSDLLDILFRLLPTLKSGVVVHFHDIPWPFEYPAQWLTEGRAWNEAYYLRALLQGNRDWQIMFFNNFLQARHTDYLRQYLPTMLEQSTEKVNLSCSSLWIRRV